MENQTQTLIATLTEEEIFVEVLKTSNGIFQSKTIDGSDSENDQSDWDNG